MSNLVLNIARGNANQEMTVEHFEVPFKDGMSLLDALFWIREHEDPSLAVRYSCRSANACKECMARVDGKAGYLCSIRAVPNSSVLIEPVKNLPLIKDLTTALE